MENAKEAALKYVIVFSNMCEEEEEIISAIKSFNPSKNTKVLYVRIDKNDPKKELFITQNPESSIIFKGIKCQTSQSPNT